MKRWHATMRIWTDIWRSIKMLKRHAGSIGLIMNIANDVFFCDKVIVCV